MIKHRIDPKQQNPRDIATLKEIMYLEIADGWATSVLFYGTDLY